MNIAVISDVHGNRQALEAVIEDMSIYKPDHVVNLGDIVGYGGDPEWCVKRVSELASISVLGNHDAFAIRKTEMNMNHIARQAVEWAAGQLSPESRSFLDSLQYYAQELDGKLGYVHSSLPNPEYFLYIMTKGHVSEHLKHQDNKLVFIGHSHSPDRWSTDGDDVFHIQPFYQENAIHDMDGPSNEKSVINVGSVGQPRDYDPRASYAIIEIEGDEARITNRRVEYDIPSAQRRILEAGLPAVLAERIEFGR